MLTNEAAMDLIKEIGLDALEFKVQDGNIIVVIPDNMNDYIDLKRVRDLQEETDTDLIKENIRTTIKDRNISIDRLTGILGVKKGTALAFSSAANKSKPNLTNVMLFAKFLSIDITDLYQDPEKASLAKPTAELNNPKITETVTEKSATVEDLANKMNNRPSPYERGW